MHLSWHLPESRWEKGLKLRATRAVAALLICAAGALASGCAGGSTAGSRATAGAGATPAAGLDVAAENAKPGTVSWSVDEARLGAQDAVEGYTDLASVAPGQSFRLYVSTTAPSFTATAYRIGYYGGAGGSGGPRGPGGAPDRGPERMSARSARNEPARPRRADNRSG
jgi:hypothetical protein